MPAGPIYKMDEVFADPQVQHLGIAVPLHHPTRGDVRVVGQPITLSRTPAKVVRRCPIRASIPTRSCAGSATAPPISRTAQQKNRLGRHG